MLHASLRRSGGSYIMTVPLSYIEQNHLDAGSRMAIEIIGDELKIKPDRPRRSLVELLAATPPGLCRAEGWGTSWALPEPSCDTRARRHPAPSV